LTRQASGQGSLHEYCPLDPVQPLLLCKPDHPDDRSVADLLPHAAQGRLCHSKELGAFERMADGKIVGTTFEIEGLENIPAGGYILRRSTSRSGIPLRFSPTSTIRSTSSSVS